MAPDFEIQVLGKFRVCALGTEITADRWRSRRAADVLKLLALEPAHALHREQVMDALWPDLPVRAAAANLRKAIHYARRATGRDEAVVLTGGLLTLDRSGLVDLDVFMESARSALESGDLDACRAAISLYAGEVLPMDRYEPWTVQSRERTHQAYTSLLRQAGQWEELLRLDPADESAHRALMLECLRRGDRRGAIRQFERLRDALREFVGVGPDVETLRVYETVLDAEGSEPPSPAERAGAILAHGLVAWGRRDLAEAEARAMEARTLALDAELPHESGEASTLLALVAYARGTWHDLFRLEFKEALNRDPKSQRAVLDAQLCFLEFYLYGPYAHAGADAFAGEMLDVAERADSDAGRALALLLGGEFALLNGDVDAAIPLLSRGADLAERASLGSCESISLERLACAHIARGDLAAAHSALTKARVLAEQSSLQSHLVVRVLGTEVAATTSMVETLGALRAAEQWLADANRVCDPCSMTLHVEAARKWAGLGNLTSARRHLADAERITGLWQGGPWTAALWEARADIRRAEGANEQAHALLLEAADGFAGYGRPLDSARCRDAAHRIAGSLVMAV